MAKEVFASAMTEGSVGLPRPDLQVGQWITLDWIGSGCVGLDRVGGWYMCRRGI